MTVDIPSRAYTFRGDLLEWAEDNFRDYPWRDPEASLYEVFIAEFFLTQTPADNVGRVYPEFVARYPSLDAVAAASVDELEAAIEQLGFQRMRAEALDAIADQVDELPRDPEKMCQLPRVGRYIANATLCFALEERLPVIDRNVVRTYERVLGDEFPDDDASRLEFAEKLLPESGEATRRYNLALLDFGALVCTKLEPKCEECFAADYCEYVSDA